MTDLYHVLNRGVEKRAVVLDDSDRARFVHDLYEFNDTAPAIQFTRHSAAHVGHPMSNMGGTTTRVRERLVDIHEWCLMGNHYHLLLSPLIENGIPLFMKKLSMGYAKYFNEKYERTGALWQGKYKRILIESDAHFLYIPYYIHLNPLDFAFPEWREGKVKNAQAALAYLEHYRWSSHLDYIGIKNFPSVTTRDFLSSNLGTRVEYEREIASIISSPELASESGRFE